MNNTMGMYQGYSVEGSAELKVTPEKMMGETTTSCNTMPGVVCQPIYECPQERCVHRQIIHEVPQDYPFMSYELMINKYKLKSYYEIIFTFIITLFILIFHP